jgi:peroxiredoxin Q/BCP
LRKFDIVYFGASCDSLEKNKKFAEKLELDYPLLSDTDGKVAGAYGILRGKRSRRTTIFVDKEGKIAHIESKVNLRDHGNQIVEQLEKLKFDKKSKD